MRVTIFGFIALFFLSSVLCGQQYKTAAAPISGSQYVVTTIAGGGLLPPLSPALKVGLGALEGIAVDAAGNVHFVANSSVFRLDREGGLTQVAGSGVPGDSGDGGPALQARFLGPAALAIDLKGNLYVADARAEHIRKFYT